MADESRTATEPLILERAIGHAPWSFAFFQALRRWENAHPEAPRIGRARTLKEETLRLGQEPSMAFAPATLSELSRGESGGAPRLSVRFLGLFGPQGALPDHLTEYARDRIRRDGDPTFSRFVDVFHHRLLAFFYRAWANAQPAVEHDRPEEDRYRRYLGALVGLGEESLKDRDALPDLAKLYYAGRFGAQARSAEGLAAILADFFGVSARVEEFVGHWLDIPEECWNQLGENETARLGSDLVLGSQQWNRQQKFRVVFGPMKLEDYERLLEPDRRRRLVAVLQNYIGYEFLWDARLVLEKDQVPLCALGEQVRLGWTTWLKSDEFEEDADDLLLNPLGAGDSMVVSA